MDGVSARKFCSIITMAPCPAKFPLWHGLFLAVYVYSTHGFFTVRQANAKRRHVGNHGSATFTKGTTRRLSTTATTINKKQNTLIDTSTPQIIPPNGRFPSTTGMNGAFSIVSYNALAPSYHALRLRHATVEERTLAIQEDRMARVRTGLERVKAIQADILCLQEVEGGAECLPVLRDILAAPVQEVVVDDQDGSTTITLPGYDQLLWTPMHPKRLDQDVVGLAIAWRSDKFTLVAEDYFRRGMVVTLKHQMSVASDKDSTETSNHCSTPTTVSIGNVHLPAKPSALEGRLRFTLSTVRRLLAQSPTGPLIFCGDLNCDQRAPHLRYYLERGYMPGGTVLKDRNYRLRLSKKSAGAMKHKARFVHAYHRNEDDLDRNKDDPSLIANVTVSLHGRGPGCMDHIYYTPDLRHHVRTGIGAWNIRPKPGKRSSRRGRGATARVRPTQFTASSSSSSSSSPKYRVAALLATMDQNYTRTQLIHDGLPNESEGFYSDHLPVGALFAPAVARADRPRIQSTERIHNQVSRHGSPSGLSTVAQQRRATYQTSAVRRHRHNAVLRTVLASMETACVGAVLRDVPLYKWPWALPGVRQKTRAPDVCAVVLGPTNDDAVVVVVVVLEVTVVQQDAAAAYAEKVEKYRDVTSALQTSVPQQSNYTTLDHTLVVALDAVGNLAPQSREDLQTLWALCGREAHVLEDLVQELQFTVQEYNNIPG